MMRSKAFFPGWYNECHQLSVPNGEPWAHTGSWGSRVSMVPSSRKAWGSKNSLNLRESK